MQETIPRTVAFPPRNVAAPLDASGLVSFGRAFPKISALEVSTVLFIFAYMAWLVWKVLSASAFLFMMPDGLSSAVRVVCVGLLVLSELFKLKESSSGLVPTGFCIFLAIAIGANVDNFEFVDLALFVFCGRTVRIRIVAKATIIAVASSVSIVVLASQAGIIVDYIWDPGVRDRHGLGFSFCTTAPHLFFGIVLAWALLRRNSVSVKECVLLLVVDFALLVLTDTRNPFILSAAVVVAVFLWSRGAFRFGGSACFVVGALPYVVFPVAIIALSWLYTADSAVLTWINDLLSNRLLYSHNSLQTYPVQPFGVVTNIGVSALGADGKLLDWWNYDTNHLDSSYLRILVYYGWILLVLACTLFFLLGSRAAREGDRLLCVLLFINAVRALVDPQLLMLQYDILLLLLIPRAGLPSASSQEVEGRS